MFRITWISNLTGATGHGDAVFTEEIALEEVVSLNQKFPEITHRVEKYEQPNLTLNVKGHRCSYGDLTFVGHPSPTVSPKVTETPRDSLPCSPSAKKENEPPSLPPPSGFSTSFF